MENITLNTCLRFFGLSRGCSTKDVKRAYRRLVRKHHPDLNKSMPCKYTINEIVYMKDILLNFIERGASEFDTMPRIRREFRIANNIFELRI